MKNKVIALIIGVLISVGIFAQDTIENDSSLNEILIFNKFGNVIYEKAIHDKFHNQLCDSLFYVQKLKEEYEHNEKIIVTENINFPYPVDKKKRDSHLIVNIPNDINVPIGSYLVFIKFIITTDSLTNCVTVMKSDNKLLNSLAIKEIENMRFVPAETYGRYIPYYYNIMLKLVKK